MPKKFNSQGGIKFLPSFSGNTSLGNTPVVPPKNLLFAQFGSGGIDYNNNLFFFKDESICIGGNYIVQREWRVIAYTGVVFGNGGYNGTTVLPYIGSSFSVDMGGANNDFWVNLTVTDNSGKSAVAQMLVIRTPDIGTNGKTSTMLSGTIYTPNLVGGVFSAINNVAGLLESNKIPPFGIDSIELLPEGVSISQTAFPTGTVTHTYVSGVHFGILQVKDKNNSPAAYGIYNKFAVY